MKTCASPVATPRPLCVVGASTVQLQRPVRVCWLTPSPGLRNNQDVEDWDALFEKVRHESAPSSHGKSKEHAARRRSLSSSEAVELRAKLDAIANSYRAAESELESMRASVKVGRPARRRYGLSRLPRLG